MTKLRPTRRHWSGPMDETGERAMRAVGWFLLILLVGGMALAVLVS